MSVTLFEGCVRGIAIVSAACHFGDNASRVASMLDYEEYRLVHWGAKVGFAPDGVRNLRLNWEIVKEILDQLHELLTDAVVLKTRYNLDYVEGETIMSKRSPGRKGIGRLWSHASPSLKRSRAEIIRGQSSPLKMLRWAALDQDKIRRIVADISQFNGFLHGLLESSDQDFVRLAIAALLRDLISRSPESSDVDVIRALLDEDTVSGSEAIDAAAQVKQTRLMLRLDKRADEVSQQQTLTQGQVNKHDGETLQVSIRPRQTLSRLSYRCLVRDTTDIGKGKETAIYRISSATKNINARVLVEWKQVDKSVDAKLEKRIQGLSLLLCNLSDESFHSLKCLGYLKQKLDGGFHNYAYVYELVDMNGDERLDIVPKVRSLSNLLNEPRKPSLTQRIHICFALAETILQLHTAGWLHKNVCAPNVLFIDNESFCWDHGMSLGPYLSGYEFARNSLEETEKITEDPGLDLYRHPDTQLGSGHLFRKAFDLYALGCTLLVIILWESLDVILSSTHKKLERIVPLPTASSENEKAHWNRTNTLKGKAYLSDKAKVMGILDRIAFSAGDTVKKAIEMCFFPTQERLEDDDEDDDILETSVNVQISIVELLKSLKEI